MTPKILSTLPGYTSHDFARDAAAGLTVAMVALPLSVAIAIASGAPPMAGLVTAGVGGLLISALGGSRVQIGGPTGAFILTVYSIIQAHGMDGLLLATLMAGVILVIAAMIGAGRLVQHVPHPVVDGFTIGVAIVIAVSQLKDLAGLSGPALPAELPAKLGALWRMRDTLQPNAVLMGIGSIAAIALLRRVAPKVPWLVLVVGAGTVVAAVAPGIPSVAARYGVLNSGLPAPRLPFASSQLIADLVPSALTIAVLAGIESLLSATVADRLIAGAHRSGAELLAQGAANIASPLFGGLPATGAIARTATNVQAGGRTPIAGIIHAVIILIAAQFASPAVGALALPSLAGVLILVAWSMSEPRRWTERLRLPRSEQAVLLLTASLTAFVDLTLALLVGTACGLALAKLTRSGARR